MGVDLTTSGSEQIAEDVDHHGRLLRIMTVMVIIGALTTGIAISMRFGIGVLVGGIFSVLNFYWLKVTLRKFVDNAANGEPLGMMGVRFILRYFLLGFIVLAVWLTGLLPIISVLFGLAGFALAVVFEGLISIFRPVKV